MAALNTEMARTAEDPDPRRRLNVLIMVFLRRRPRV